MMNIHKPVLFCRHRAGESRGFEQSAGTESGAGRSHKATEIGDEHCMTGAKSLLRLCRASISSRETRLSEDCNRSRCAQTRQTASLYVYPSTGGRAYSGGSVSEGGNGDPQQIGRAEHRMAVKRRSSRPGKQDTRRTGCARGLRKDYEEDFEGISRRLNP